VHAREQPILYSVTKVMARDYLPFPPVGFEEFVAVLTPEVFFGATGGHFLFQMTYNQGDAVLGAITFHQGLRFIGKGSPMVHVEDQDIPSRTPEKIQTSHAVRSPGYGYGYFMWDDVLDPKVVLFHTRLR